MTSTNTPVVEVNHGIANNFGSYIEVNKNLKNYPHLLKPIMEHEFAHTDKTISMEDFKLDFILPPAIHYKELFKFMFRHPKSFTQLLPLYYTKKKGIVIDFNMMVMYLMMIGVIGLTVYLGGRYL